HRVPAQRTRFLCFRVVAAQARDLLRQVTVCVREFLDACDRTAGVLGDSQRVRGNAVVFRTRVILEKRDGHAVDGVFEGIGGAVVLEAGDVDDRVQRIVVLRVVRGEAGVVLEARQ